MQPFFLHSFSRLTIIAFCLAIVVVLIYPLILAVTVKNILMDPAT